MIKWAIVIFNKYSVVLDYEVFDDVNLAEKTYDKLIKHFKKDPKAHEFLLQEFLFEGDFKSKKYEDLVRGSKSSKALRFASK